MRALAALVGRLLVAVPTRPVEPHGSGGDDRTPGRRPVAAPGAALLADAIAEGRLDRSSTAVLADPDLGHGRAQSCRIVDRSPTCCMNPADPADAGVDAQAADRLRRAHPARARRPPWPPRAGQIGARPSGVVIGDLWLVGGGDPLLVTADYAASFKDQPHLFTDLATPGRRRRRRRGHAPSPVAVVGDDTRYDAERYVPSWKPSYATEGHIGAVERADRQRRLRRVEAQGGPNPGARRPRPPS